jgi:hypothetical protein
MNVPAILQTITSHDKLSFVQNQKEVTGIMRVALWWTKTPSFDDRFWSPESTS